MEVPHEVTTYLGDYFSEASCINLFKVILVNTDPDYDESIHTWILYILRVASLCQSGIYFETDASTITVCHIPFSSHVQEDDKRIYLRSCGMGMKFCPLEIANTSQPEVYFKFVDLAMRVHKLLVRDGLSSVYGGRVMHSVDRPTNLITVVTRYSIGESFFPDVDETDSLLSKYKKEKMGKLDSECFHSFVSLVRHMESPEEKVLFLSLFPLSWTTEHMCNALLAYAVSVMDRVNLCVKICTRHRNSTARKASVNVTLAIPTVDTETGILKDRQTMMEYIHTQILRSFLSLCAEENPPTRTVCQSSCTLENGCVSVALLVQ